MLDLGKLDLGKLEIGDVIVNPEDGRDYIVTWDPVANQNRLVLLSEDDDEGVHVFEISIPTKEDFAEFTKIILEDLELSPSEADQDIIRIIWKMYKHYQVTKKMYYGPTSI
jgi:hypothetical protein